MSIAIIVFVCFIVFAFGLGVIEGNTNPKKYLPDGMDTIIPLLTIETVTTPEIYTIPKVESVVVQQRPKTSHTVASHITRPKAHPRRVSSRNAAPVKVSSKIDNFKVDCVSALQNLGYKKNNAIQKYQYVMKKYNPSTIEEFVRFAFTKGN